MRAAREGDDERAHLTAGDTSAPVVLAQVNLARFRRPAGDDVNAPYLDALAAVDAAAECQPGFIWRLRDAGHLARGADLFGPDAAVNLSLWRDAETLEAFVYRSPGHRAIMTRRREWFDAMSFHLALWWVPAGTRPTLEDARAALDRLARCGPGPAVFTFAQRFPPPFGPVPASWHTIC